MSKNKTIFPDLNSWSKYKFAIEVNGQGQTEVMNVCDTMVIHSHVKHSMIMSKDKNVVTLTKSHVINPINLTLRSKLNVISGPRMYSMMQ